MIIIQNECSDIIGCHVIIKICKPIPSNVQHWPFTKKNKISQGTYERTAQKKRGFSEQREEIKRIKSKLYV